MGFEAAWFMAVKLVIDTLEIETQPGLELNGGTGGEITVNGDIFDESFWNSTFADISHKSVEDIFWWKGFPMFDGKIRSQIEVREVLLESKILSELKEAWMANGYNFVIRNSAKFVFGEIPCYECIVKVDYFIEYVSINNMTSQNYKADHHVVTPHGHQQDQCKRWHIVYRVMLLKIFVILFVIVSIPYVYLLIVHCDH